jgi:hypothetical protein
VNRVPLDLTDPRDNLYAFAKMWGTFGDEPHLSTFHGAMYASVGTRRLMPLVGYAGTGVTKCRFLDNGTLQLRGKETGYFYDLASGDVIDTWENPFTGRTVEVYHFLNDRIGGELTTTMPKLHVGDDPDHGVEMNEFAPKDDDGTTPFVLPWAAYGDELLLEWDYAHEYPNPVTPSGWPQASTGPVINPSEHFTIFTSRAEMEDRDRPSAHFRAGFSRLSPFWPWMRMGGSGVEGVMFGRLFSRTTHRGFDDVPPKILARIEHDCPDYLEFPTDWDMGPILSTWEAFARDVPREVADS